MSEITSEILAAFDEIKDEPDEEIEPSPAHEDVPVTEPEEEEEQEEEPEEEEEEEEEEDLVGDEQPEEEVAAFEDPAIQSFLAKYGGDVEKALRGAVELSVVLGRQGSEKSAALARVQELEQELQQLQALSGLEETYLTEEQNQWVEEAIASQNPRGYVHSAMQAGEYDLARAVLREWSRESPYEAMRAGQFVDQAQQQAMQQYQQPVEEPIDQGLLLNLLAQNYPDMTGYWGQMETMLHQLGPDHPTVIDARGNDVERSARAIINLYEIARASTASVQSAKDEIKQKRRRAANDARNGAVVSSGAASRTTETPRRSIMVTPGLTLEQLDAEFEAASK